MNKIKIIFFVIVLSIEFILPKGITKTPIFPFQNQHVHGSSIIEAPNGDLLACWFYGSGERTANDVIIQGSRLKKEIGRASCRERV